jgi:hypothetical protein
MMALAKVPQRELWDQRQGESDSAYSRYLVYRNLGPARSLTRAYAVYLGQAAQGGEPLLAPGAWKKDCARWKWVERAATWDVATLSEAGAQAVAAFVALIREVSLRLLEATQNGDLRPQTWEEVLETIEILGRHVPSELVLKAAERPG